VLCTGDVSGVSGDWMVEDMNDRKAFQWRGYHTAL
jgi:hypothetical protein